jgi:hypothetical protein
MIWWSNSQLTILVQFKLLGSRRLGEVNPYHFKERTYTGGDREFWTKTQACFWDDFYSSPDHMRNGTFV